jgi:hypothetical protein
MFFVVRHLPPSSFVYIVVDLSTIIKMEYVMIELN